MIVEVQTRSGHGGRPEPQALRLGARTVALVEIQDTWPGADHTYFKAAGDDGALYILRHDATRSVWELTMYSAGPPRA